MRAPIRGPIRPRARAGLRAAANLSPEQPVDACCQSRAHTSPAPVMELTARGGPRRPSGGPPGREGESLSNPFRKRAASRFSPETVSAVRFIAEHRERWGLEPICRVLRFTPLVR